jgi:hypothetical protein
MGGIIQRKEVSGDDRYEFSLAGKSPGIYFIRVMAGDRLETQKIIRK